MNTFTDHEVPGGIVRVRVEDAEAGSYRITALHGRAQLIGVEATVSGADEQTLAAIVGAIRVTIPAPRD